MSRYIDADKLIQLKCIEKCGKVADYCQCKCFDLDDIKNFPTVEVTPIVYGKWISGIDKDHQAYCYCSNCTVDAHEQDADFIKSNFCPNCGAKMKKEKTE